MVKLLMSWDIIPGQEGEYFEFIIHEFEPGVTALGLQTTDVWYTIYGNWPQIVTGAVAANLQTMQRVLMSKEWKDLKRSLRQFITDYQQKIIPANGGYQL